MHILFVIGVIAIVIGIAMLIPALGFPGPGGVLIVVGIILCLIALLSRNGSHRWW